MSCIHFLLLLFITGVFSNSDECATDTNPFIQIGGKHYFINTGVQISWIEAVHLCRTYNSDLATIESVVEMDYLSFYLTTNGHTDKRFWTSGNDFVAEGKFMSLSTGRPMSYARWAGGEPNSLKNAEDCVQLVAVNEIFYMNDVACNAGSYTICEKRMASEFQNGEEKCANVSPQCAVKKLQQIFTQMANIINSSG